MNTAACGSPALPSGTSELPTVSTGMVGMPGSSARRVSSSAPAMSSLTGLAGRPDKRALSVSRNWASRTAGPTLCMAGALAARYSARAAAGWAGMLSRVAAAGTATDAAGMLTAAAGAVQFTGSTVPVDVSTGGLTVAADGAGRVGAADLGAPFLAGLFAAAGGGAPTRGVRVLRDPGRGVEARSVALRSARGRSGPAFSELLELSGESATATPAACPKSANPSAHAAAPVFTPNPFIDATPLNRRQVERSLSAAHLQRNSDDSGFHMVSSATTAKWSLAQTVSTAAVPARAHRRTCPAPRRRGVDTIT